MTLYLCMFSCYISFSCYCCVSVIMRVSMVWETLETLFSPRNNMCSDIDGYNPIIRKGKDGFGGGVAVCIRERIVHLFLNVFLILNVIFGLRLALKKVLCWYAQHITHQIALLKTLIIQYYYWRCNTITALYPFVFTIKNRCYNIFTVSILYLHTFLCMHK